MEPDKEAELNFQGSIEHYKQIGETRRALMTSLNTWATHALRGIFVLNGGAAIAVLAHLETLRSNPSSVYGFTRGAMFAVVASAFAYLSELFSILHLANSTSASDKRLGPNKTLAYTWFTLGVICFVVAASFFITSCYLFMEQVRGIEHYLSNSTSPTK